MKRTDEERVRESVYYAVGKTYETCARHVYRKKQGWPMLGLIKDAVREARDVVTSAADLAYNVSLAAGVEALAIGTVILVVGIALAVDDKLHGEG